MKLYLRAYSGEDDYWRIRAFLREVFLLNYPLERSWQTYRFDYWRWHGNENIEKFQLEEVTFIWEQSDGRVAAVLNPEGRGEAFLQVHPDFRTPQLEEEMLAAAEEHLSTAAPGGEKQIGVWLHEHDHLREELLTRQGYRPRNVHALERRRPISLPVPYIHPAIGYTIRPLGDVDELPARSWLSWRAFHPDEPDERYEGWEWYLNVQRAPLYRRDLDLVAVSQDGELAAFSTIWFDDVTRTGAFEPVGTAPEHRRRGLGKAVLCEGLRRLERLGARLAFVASYGPEAHALYASVGFTQYEHSELWEKQLP